MSTEILTWASLVISLVGVGLAVANTFKLSHNALAKRSLLIEKIATNAVHYTEQRFPKLAPDEKFRHALSAARLHDKQFQFSDAEFRVAIEAIVGGANASK